MGSLPVPAAWVPHAAAASLGAAKGCGKVDTVAVLCTADGYGKGGLKVATDGCSAQPDAAWAEQLMDVAHAVMAAPRAEGCSAVTADAVMAVEVEEVLGTGSSLTAASRSPRPPGRRSC